MYNAVVPAHMYMYVPVGLYRVLDVKYTYVYVREMHTHLYGCLTARS